MGILYRDRVISYRGQIPSESESDPGLIFLILVYTHGSKPDLGQKFIVFISIITQNILNNIDFFPDVFKFSTFYKKTH